MGQDVKELYRRAEQYMGSLKVRKNIHQFGRYADRLFSKEDFVEQYYDAVNKGMKRCKPETLGKILAQGMPKESAPDVSVKAKPRAHREVGKVPRFPYLSMVPDRDSYSYFFSDMTGFGYLAQLATQVILAAMLDLAYQHVASLDAEKGVHVLDLVALELEGWDDGLLTWHDLEPLFSGMVSRGQTVEACSAAWQAFLPVASNYSIGVVTNKLNFDKGVERKNAISVVESTSLKLWHEGYGQR